MARPWSKYDFVPGETVLFEVNLEGEQNGEFPSQWDLIDGYVENALFSGENVIGSGLTKTKEEQIDELTAAAARAAENWMRKQPWFFENTSAQQPQ